MAALASKFSELSLLAGSEAAETVVKLPNPAAVVANKVTPASKPTNVFFKPLKNSMTFGPSQINNFMY